MSAKALADGVGITNGAITNYKNGSYPRADVAVKIAQLLGVTVEYLVTGDDSKMQKVNTVPADIQKLIDQIERLDSVKKSFLMDSIKHQLIFIDSVS